MKPFEEALSDAVLEEYAVLPCDSTDTADQHSRNRKKDRNYASHPSIEIARQSLWLAKGEKCIFLRSTPDTRQYYFRTQENRDMYFYLLLHSGFVLKKQRS